MSTQLMKAQHSGENPEGKVACPALATTANTAKQPEKGRPTY